MAVRTDEGGRWVGSPKCICSLRGKAPRSELHLSASGPLPFSPTHLLRYASCSVLQGDVLRLLHTPHVRLLPVSLHLLSLQNAAHALTPHPNPDILPHHPLRLPQPDSLTHHQDLVSSPSHTHSRPSIQQPLTRSRTSSSASSHPRRSASARSSSRPRSGILSSE